VSTPHKGQGAPQNFGPFVLERRIAVGGSAEVFLARPKIGPSPAPRLVVKKLLASAREGGDFDALEREAELHRAVRHPNVVEVFGAGMVGEEPYLALEYVEGVDLYRLLRRAESEQRRLPAGLAVFIAREVLAALSSVHAAKDDAGSALNIVHRDVTPSNIYLSVEGHVKLGDFGIARFEQGLKPTQHSAGLKGKFGYLAPEQVAGEPFDHRADLFALAAVLGEMLIGERVFPGSGQLAVLLAIRDVNIEPLRRAKLEQRLLQVCEKGLAREPDDRYENAERFAEALADFERPSRRVLKDTLAEWVVWARDSSQLAKRIEGQIRDSVQRMQAARRVSSGALAALRSNAESDASEPLRPTDPVGAGETFSRVRRGAEELPPLSFAKLIEMIALGDLGADDEVALMGADFRRIQDIDELARHLLPSTTATTSRLFEPGAPDYQALLRDTSMLDVLTHMRRRAESGALFVTRATGDGGSSRKEIYLNQGRLLHVASSEREELLGEYLVRRGRITRRELETALGKLSAFGGRLGDTLIGLGLVDAVDVFRAIRDQGRDRVAALCGWSDGLVMFYRGTTPTRVEFPLDLDLASALMAGAIVKSKGEPRSLLPDGARRLLPGPRAAETRDPRERGAAPASLQHVLRLVEERVSVDRALERLLAYRPGRDARAIGAKEACAALIAAELLGWIAFEA
jgi:serine/threonine protein kinase